MSALIADGISVEGAERITEQIVGRLGSITENVEAVRSLMREAIERGAHAALGYASPGAYVADRFGASLAGLSVSLRREIVHELTDAGLSTRAIAPIVGVAQKTVVKDRQVLPEVTPAPGATDAQVFSPEHLTNAQPEAGDTPGITSDAKTALPVVPAVRANPSTGEVTEAKQAEAAAEAPRPVAPVVGLDGKTYTRPTPRSAPKAVLGGDDLTRVEAVQNAKSLGACLGELEGLTYPAHRAAHLTKWWPAGSDAVAPTKRDLFTPTHLREFASALLAFATELEDSK